MKGAKLLKILHGLDPAELGRLRRFLHSPYLNPREDVRILFDYLVNAPEEELMPDKQQLFQELFPDQQLSDREIRDRMRYLLDCVERFLELEELKGDKLERGQQLLAGFWKRKMEGPFRTKYKFIRRRLEATQIRDALYHHHNFRLWEAHYNATQTRPGETHEELQAMAKHLDLYFILQKLRVACSVVSHQQLYQVEYELGLLEPILAYIEQKELTQNPSVGMYYAAYKMLTLKDESEPHFFNLKVGLLSENPPFGPGEMKSLFRLAINFCIKRLNRGAAQFLREVFELYRMALATRILLEDDVLSPFTYKNIVSAGLKLSEYEWVKQFLEEFKPFLPELQREDFYLFNLAEWHFARKEFAEVPRILLNQHSRDPFTALSGRIILIKSYVELGELKLVEYQLDSFKHFLRRRSVITYHREHYQNFIKFANRLIGLAPNGDKEVNKLEKEIREAEALSEREWLLQQLVNREE